MNTDASVATEALPRPHRHALKLMALTLWLPCVVPILLGMLRDCSHCVQSYLLMVPLVPGIIAAVLLRLDDFAFVLGAAVPTALIGYGVYLAARKLPRRPLGWIQGVVAVVVASQAVVLCSWLRA